VGPDAATLSSAVIYAKLSRVPLVTADELVGLVTNEVA
jgi:hypothetical protein